MRKNRVTKELILLGVLIFALAYYLLFFKNITAQIDNYEGQLADMNSNIQTATMKIEEMNKMKIKLDEITNSELFAEPLPQYNNLNMVLLELNTILSGTNKYNIDFSDAIGNNNIARRTIKLSFSVPSYGDGVKKIREVNNSANRYLITDISYHHGVNNEITLGSTDREASVSMVLTCFEYIMPDGEQPPKSEDGNSSGGGSSSDNME